MPKPQPVLLDTDIGTDVDDAIALALLLACPELDLQAVTTVCGDTALRARIAKKLLTLAGRADVPAAAGIREPILRQRNFLWLGHEGSGILRDGEAPPLSGQHGVELFIDTVLRCRPHVVAIGPLSNLAVAVMKEPKVIGAISHLTVMGGLIRPAELPVPLLDYNLTSDAEAAMVVLGAGIPTTLVPLDVTWRVPLAAADVRRLRRRGTPLLQTLCDAIDVWAPLQRAFLESVPGAGDSAALLHDPLTVAVVVERSFVTMERLRLRPALAEATIRWTEEPGAPEIEVATAVDKDRFVDFLLRRLLEA